MNTTIIKTESLGEFYKRTNQEIPVDLLNEQSGRGHFNVKQSTTIGSKTPYNRRDYFKVCLNNGGGTGIFRYNGQEYILNRPCLIFTNPSVPASIEIPSASASRYYCLFNSRFIEGHISSGYSVCLCFIQSFTSAYYMADSRRKERGFIIILQSNSFCWKVIILSNGR